MSRRQVSVSPTGEEFPIPGPDEYAAEFVRLKRLVASQRKKGREIVVVVGVGFVGAVMAAVVAAPGLGFAFTPDRLSHVSVPVQLWSAEQDANVPYASNTRLVRAGLGSRAEFHSVPGAGHFSFLAPCGLLKPPGVCSDPGSFDRKDFHASMNASVVGFFDAHLNAP